MLLVGALVVSAVAAGAMWANKLRNAPPKSTAAPATRVHLDAEYVPKPQPSGPVPPGKVWSVEHGHWHNLPAAVAAPAPRPLTEPPPGPAPDGKVWSREHGHWHTIPGYVAPIAGSTTAAPPVAADSGATTPTPALAAPPAELADESENSSPGVY